MYIKDNKDNKETFLIRKAELSDCKQLSEFAKKTFRETYTDMYSIEQIIELENNILSEKHFFKNISLHSVIIAFDIQNQHDIIGYCVCIQKLNSNYDFIPNKHTVEISKFYIDSKFFGKGLAKQLMNECLRLANKNPIWVSVSTFNPRAIKFYYKYGFIKVGERLWSENILKNGKQDLDQIQLRIN
jgi:ribosomal protein S18 acetylase RimI-like enzyme